MIPHPSLPRSLLFTFFLCLQILTPVTGHGEPDQATVFNLPLLFAPDQSMSTSDLKGKVALLSIWATWCPSCKDEMPLLMDLQDLFPEDLFTVVTINVDNKRENAVLFLEELSFRENRPLNFISIYDEEKVMVRALGPHIMPTSYLLDAHGKIIRSFPGSITEKKLPEVRAAITSSLDKQ